MTSSRLDGAREIAIFIWIVDVDENRNHIPSLPSNLFGENAYMSRLKVIDLTNNGIREIRGKTFHHVANVERLVLDHNNISIADEEDKNFHHPRVFSNFVNLQELHLTNAFADNTDSALADDLHDIFVNSNLTKLYKLHLEQNEIKNFKDETVFCDLPDLHDLHLGDNDIPSLNFDVTCLRKLRYLDLEFNNITEFTQRELDALDALATSPGREENLQVEVNGNPLKCESVIRRFYPWTQTSRVQVRHLENLECAQAKYGKKYPVKVMSLIESRHVKISQSLTVLLAVLLCVLISLMVAYFYLKRDQMRSRFSPILEAITRKVQYTTIEAQDV
ncbi:leucine-rich repeat-containing protein 70 isoform X2 [Cylas formicarius]|uniref:leucine-rich repeat-containing protein 70 isoform X2 n=1 Tax=Cylas formicarius TaxID=197179 RepID=UPI0029589145|nr:leucine-rich repeat-containing protein 70 isoform X2 [Cylas formicarius]